MEALKAIDIPAKKTYQKHKMDGVISILHLENSKLKPKMYDNIPYFPLYVRITVKQKVTTIKSNISMVFHVGAINTLDKNSDNYKLINYDKRIIEKIIEYYNPFQRENFKISEVSKRYAELSTMIAFFKSHYLSGNVGYFMRKFANENGIDEDSFIDCINFDNNDIFDIIKVFKKIIPDLGKLVDNEKDFFIFAYEKLLGNNALFYKLIDEPMRVSDELIKIADESFYSV
jgi:hypothetical protein